MYIVTIKNGDVAIPIHDANIRLLSGSVVQGIGTIDSFKFTLSPNNPGFGNLTDYTTLVEVFNRKMNRYEFSGRVLCSGVSMDEKGRITQEATCESGFGFFCDSLQEPVEEKLWSVQEYLNHVVSVHNSQVEEYKQFTVSCSLSKNVYLKIERTSTWGTITKQLLETAGGEIKFQVFEGKNYIYYGDKLADRKDTEIAISRNMKSITREIDPSSFITRLIPFGAKLKDENGKETDNRLTLGSGAKKYVDHEEGIKKYGIHVGFAEFDDATDTYTLRNKANSWLALNNKVLVKYSITALDLSLINLDIDDFQVYNYYPIKNGLLSIDDIARINKKTIDVCEGTKSSFEIGDSFKTLSELQKDQTSSLNKFIGLINKDLGNYATKQSVTDIRQAIGEMEDGTIINIPTLIDNKLNAALGEYARAEDLAFETSALSNQIASLRRSELSLRARVQRIENALDQYHSEWIYEIPEVEVEVEEDEPTP